MGVTLTEFLLARIAEDEAAALPGLSSIPDDTFRRGVASNMARVDRVEKMQVIALDFRCPTCHANRGDTCVAMTPPHHAPKPAGQFHGSRRDLAAVEFRRRYGSVSHWNSARVLAECEAKRRIVEWATDGDHSRDLPFDERYVLAALALPYADHPDCDEEWKP